MKKPTSLDLRERIVAAYVGKEGTREEVAKRLKVSVGMVKKLLSQQGRTGDLRPSHRFCGRKAQREPDVTLSGGWAWAARSARSTGC